jgi:hypothetical protein
MHHLQANKSTQLFTLINTRNFDNKPLNLTIPEWLLRASPMALHLHLHLRFFIHDADVDAGLGPSGLDLYKSRMRMSAWSVGLHA